MVPSIESATKAMLGQALEATTMRHQAIAQNIANVNTPDYRAVDVSFEDQLSGVRDQLEQGHGVSAAMMAQYHPTLVSADRTGSDGGAVSLEMELAKLSENTLHQQVLLKLLNSHYSVMASALK